MRILVVEDDARISRDVVTTLGAAGYVVETAGDGEDAWFRGDTEDYDLVILDLGLLKMDGLAVTEALAVSGAVNARPGAHGAWHMGGARGGHRRRRRRLSAEAVPYGGVAGANPCPAAALRGSSASVIEAGPLSLDTRQMRVTFTACRRASRRWNTGCWRISCTTRAAASCRPPNCRASLRRR